MKNPTIFLFNMLEQFRKTIRTKQCAFSYCVNKDIISAHSIQKNGPLKQIAENGVVYQIKQEIINGSAKSIISKVGLKQASAHYMFCKKHEDLFSVIENNNFKISTEHVFLASLRSLMMELYKRTLSIQFFTKNLEKISNAPEIKDFLNNYINNLKEGERDMKEAEAIYCKALKTNNFNNFQYLVLEFSKPIGIVSAGGIHITMNFKNTITLQDLSLNTPLEMLFLSCVSTENETYFIFHYPESYNKSKKFMESFILLSREDKIGYFIQFLFNRCENTFFSNSFWQNLSSNQQQWLLQLWNPINDFNTPQPYKTNFFFYNNHPRIHTNI